MEYSLDSAESIFLIWIWIKDFLYWHTRTHNKDKSSSKKTLSDSAEYVFPIWILHPSSFSYSPCPTSDSLTRLEVQLINFVWWYSFPVSFPWCDFCILIYFDTFLTIFLSFFFPGVTLINGDIFIRRHAIDSIQSVDSIYFVKGHWYTSPYYNCCVCLFVSLFALYLLIMNNHQKGIFTSF